MQTITRKLWFSAGHRVFGHESECANLHGHNYIVNIEAVKDDGNLDGIGRVIDFKVLKNKIDPWLQTNWDHAFLWNEQDPIGQVLFSKRGYSFRQGVDILEEIQAMKNFCCPFNPTAEEMAQHLLETVCPMLLEGTGVTVTKVELLETENCKATAELRQMSPQRFKNTQFA